MAVNHSEQIALKVSFKNLRKIGFQIFFKNHKVQKGSHRVIALTLSWQNSNKKMNSISKHLGKSKHKSKDTEKKENKK